MDLWGLCASCERWFYCEDADPAAQDAPPEWACPVCGREPESVENRAAAARIDHACAPTQPTADPPEEPGDWNVTRQVSP